MVCMVSPPRRKRRIPDTRTMLTAVIAAGWIASFVVRLERPDWPAGPAADSVMLVSVTYWFAARAIRPGRANDDDDENGGDT